MKTSVLNPDLKNQIKSWKNFYKKEFGIEKDFSNIRIPDSKGGFDRLIVVVPEISSADIFLNHIRLMPGSHRCDLSLRAADEYSNRVQINDYGVWIEDVREPKIRNKTTFSIRHYYSFVTLKEELLFALKYYEEFGRFINTYSYSICAGSVFLDGRIPTLSCINNDGFQITSIDMYTKDDFFGHRRAIV